jgi:hypothetical protein
VREDIITIPGSRAAPAPPRCPSDLPATFLALDSVSPSVASVAVVRQNPLIPRHLTQSTLRRLIHDMADPAKPAETRKFPAAGSPAAGSPASPKSPADAGILPASHWEAVCFLTRSAPAVHAHNVCLSLTQHPFASCRSRRRGKLTTMIPSSMTSQAARPRCLAAFFTTGLSWGGPTTVRLARPRAGLRTMSGTRSRWTCSELRCQHSTIGFTANICPLQSHHMSTLLLGGKLFLAPVGEKPQVSKSNGRVCAV